MSERNVRGEVHMGIAVSFRRHFPIGKQFSTHKFDTFCIQKKWMRDARKSRLGSAAHTKMLYERHEAKKKINVGGACRLLPPQERFQIEVIKQGITWKTKQLDDFAMDRMQALPHRINEFYGARREALVKLVDSHDFGQLSPMTQRLIEELERGLRDSARRVEFDLTTTTANFREVCERAMIEARDLMDDGTTLNGGLIEFLGGLDALTGPVEEEVEENE